MQLCEKYLRCVFCSYSECNVVFVAVMSTLIFVTVIALVVAFIVAFIVTVPMDIFG